MVTSYTQLRQDTIKAASTRKPINSSPTWWTAPTVWKPR
jgi:hypothetical protein